MTELQGMLGMQVGEPKSSPPSADFVYAARRKTQWSSH
jgi:hypothetical protein